MMEMNTIQELLTIEQWKNVLAQSKEKPLLLLKHSTTCPISAFAYREYAAYTSPIDTYLVKVIEHRDVSNEIESDLGIRHQSPQAFLIANGNVAWHDSHRNITTTALEKAIASI